MSALKDWQVTDLVNQLEAKAGPKSDLKFTIGGVLGSFGSHIVISAGMRGTAWIYQDGRVEIRIHATATVGDLAPLAKLHTVLELARKLIDRYKRTNRATDPR